MKTQNFTTSPGRFALGLLASFLSGAIVFTLTAYETRLFFPYFIVVLAVSACFTLFVMLPIALILMKMRSTELISTMACVGVVTILIFAAWNYSALSGATSLIIGEKTLVQDSMVLYDGWVAIARETALTALIASLASSVFWKIAFNQKN